jgi:hypothetical protein
MQHAPTNNGINSCLFVYSKKSCTFAGLLKIKEIVMNTLAAKNQYTTKISDGAGL